MRRRSLVVWVVGPILLAAIAAVAATAWVLGTESGTRWAVGQAMRFAGPSVTLERLSGTLSDAVELEGLVVTLGGGDRVDVARARLTIDDVAWLARRVTIGELEVGDVDYRRQAAGRTASGDGAGGFELPLSIDVVQASLARLRVETGDTAFDMGPASARVELSGRQLTLSGLAAQAAGVTVDGDFTLRFSDVPELTADADWSTELDGLDWSGSIEADGPLSALAIRSRLRTPLELSADGELDLADTPRFDVEVGWESLAWPGFDIAQAQAGRVQLSGWIDAVEFSGASVVVIDGIRGDVTTAGTATPERVSIASLHVDSAYGSADAAGAVDVDPLMVELNVDARGLDPSVRLPDWPGAIDVAGHVEVSVEPELDVSVANLTAAGTLRGQPVAASGDLDWRSPRALHFGAVTVNWAGNEAYVDGTAADRLDLDVRVDAPDLSMAGSDLAGRVGVDGRLEGTIDAPSFIGTANATDLGVRGYSVDTVTVDAAIEGLDEPVLNVQLRAGEIRRGERPLARTVSAGLRGTPAAHEIGIDIDSALGRSRIEARGGLSAANWRGQIGAVTIDQDLLGRWSLDRPVRVEAGRDGLKLGRGCLRNASSSLCAAAEVGTADEHVEVSVEAFELGTLQPLAGDLVESISGRYDAAVDLSGPLQRPTGSFTLSGGSTLIRLAEQEAPIDLPIESVRLDGTIGNDRFTMKGSIVGPSETNATFDATVTDIWTPAPSIDARVDGRWDDLAALSVLSPDVGEVSGSALVALMFGGSLAAPEVSGEARLSGGRVAVPRWGFLMDQIDLVARSPDGRRLDYEISGRAGDGVAKITGTTRLDPAERWPTQMTLTGENLQAVQNPEAEIVVAPDLEIDAQWPVISVSGLVTVPSARLTLEQLPAQAVSTSPDAVVHGGPVQPAPRRPLDMHADLQVVLGDDVSFIGAGLDADLSGQLGLVYRSGESASASGSVFIGGQYSAFGRSFDLERGRLLFNGPVGDPGLDVLAVRRIPDAAPPVTVGVQLGGTVNNPTTRLYSDPSMAEADILSYLVVGRPLSESSEANSEVLRAAAVSLGVTQAIPQIQHFGESIGLDELSVRASEANAGELMAGKQLSSRIYVRYTYGLFNRVGGLLMRFKLTDKLDLEALSGDYQAMDLLYTVEKE